MSKESAIQFLENLRENERAEEILQSKEEEILQSKEIKLKLLAEVAAELGEDISAEDFEEALADIEAMIRQKTDASVCDMEALEDDDVEDVAGGQLDIPDCAKPHEEAWEDFWACLLNDRCSKTWNCGKLMF